MAGQGQPAAVARLGADSLTKSGYPFIIKTLKRGQTLDQAQELFRGAASDQLMSMPILLSDGQGNRAAFLFRGVTFFGNETWLLTAQGTKRLALPAKSQLQGMVDG